MNKGIILDSNDVKKIIAEYFGVDVSKVIKAQYSYIVSTGEETDGKEST